ncbi:semaphorin-4A [Cheilinus undulatus]|uniref:semaphorin-4A n=1 Tax=Cheilinus undulatus TaxID=241271 RepID=UPI001BD50816|nr:semaphorin-4A [Cheilinus undulatus]
MVSSIVAPLLLALVVLAILLGSSASLPPPRKTFLLNSTDRPLLVFSLPDVQNTTTLLLSDDGSTLYVGARDAVLSLDVSRSDVIRLKNRVAWRPSETATNECKYKVKNPSLDCPNIISVLKPINSTHLYACGSHAYSPQDAFIDTEIFSVVEHSSDKAKTRCPHNPFQRSTAITYDGELFTATTTDFKGEKPQILRHFTKDGRLDVRLDSPVSLLQDPTFIGSSLDPSDRKLYFFFTEVGKEFRFVDELQIARVAQVCKDDVGGQMTLQKKWTSFAKAPLLCQSPKRLPFNVLQDVFTLQPAEGDNASDTLFYGIFSSQWSSGPESAVCVFSLQDVRNVFSGNYMTLNAQTMVWSQRPGRQIQGKCGLEHASDSDLEEVKNSFLTSQSVTPVGNAPVVISSGQQYSRVAAMKTTAANGDQHTLLFLLTESGFLHKLVLSGSGGARVIEEIQVFEESQPLKSLVLSSVKGVLYVGTSEGVTAVPVARCSVYTTCSQCILARDPLCGWSRRRRVCTRVEDGHDDTAQDVENGDVGEACLGQTKTSPITEMSVEMNTAVSLSCQKPSNPSTLTWTSPQFEDLPHKLFIQSSDGSLLFHATEETQGTYRCAAQEGGHKEVVARYRVSLTPPPRSMRPSPKNDQEPVPDDENYELTEDPGIISRTPSGDLEDATVTVKAEERDPAEERTQSEEDPKMREDSSTGPGSDFDLASTSDSPSFKAPRDGAPKEKSYYSELVAVSLLFSFICIGTLVLGAFYMWRQTKTGKINPLVSLDGGSKTDQSMESVPSLSSPEDDAPELKVVE